MFQNIISLHMSTFRKSKTLRSWERVAANKYDNSVGPEQSSISIALNKNGKIGWWHLDQSLKS